MPIINPIRPLLRRLSEIGYKEKYVRLKALPDWWEDSLALNPAGYQQAIMLLSRNLNLDARSLLETNAPVRCREIGTPKYKLKPSDTPESVRVATCIAFRAAQLACQAMPVPFDALPASAMEIRRDILREGAACISFEALLDYCWRVGVPVLHVGEFPVGACKPDALAVIVDGRPVIVLCRQTEYSAWLLFHLAHELGHIVLGHLQGAALLVDEEVKGDRDEEETAANTFAVELLTGFTSRSYYYGGVSAAQLADVATAVGRDTNVDAGFIALSHGRISNFWGAANGAVRLIERQPNAIEKVQARIRQRLDRERLSRDSDDFLMRMTGADDGA